MAAILLVEDVEILRTVLSKFLKSAGHVVTECAGGDEARRTAAVKTFDLIVTDLWMRDGDGLAFIRSQATGGRSSPVIAMTGGDPSVTQSKSGEFARQAGATLILSKPVTKTEILNAVGMALVAA